MREISKSRYRIAAEEALRSKWGKQAIDETWSHSFVLRWMNGVRFLSERDIDELRDGRDKAQKAAANLDESNPAHKPMIELWQSLLQNKKDLQDFYNNKIKEKK